MECCFLHLVQITGNYESMKLNVCLHSQIFLDLISVFLFYFRIYLYNMLQLEKGPISSFSGCRIASFFIKVKHRSTACSNTQPYTSMGWLFSNLISICLIAVNHQPRCISHTEWIFWRKCLHMAGLNSVNLKVKNWLTVKLLLHKVFC